MRLLRLGGFISCALFVMACGRDIEELASRQIRHELTTIEGKYSEPIRALYAGNDHQVLWSRGEALRLMDSICDAQVEGLEPDAFDMEQISDRFAVAYRADRVDEARAEAVAAVDIHLSLALLRLVEQRHNGRLDPERLFESWHIEPDRSFDIDEVAREMNADRLTRGAALEIPPLHAYETLRTAVERYVDLEASGGWPQVGGNDPLRKGSRGEAVTRLRERLAAENDLPSEERGGDLFDENLEAALKRFQERHGIDPDGILDQEERTAMNVPVEGRIRQMQINLERYRWLPDRWEDERIVINIPEFVLRAYRGLDQDLEMAVVVGKSLNPTPVFRDQMTHVILRPYWNIPVSIAIEEILPELAKDPGYLAKKNYEIVDQEGAVTQASFKAGFFRTMLVGSPPDPTPADGDPIDGQAARPGRGSTHDQPALNAESLEAHELMLRQRPGPGNALGRIKFMLPNDFDVYLHDTPEQVLFDESRRDFSHGCVRVEDPIGLAAWLLEDKEEWSADRIRNEAHEDGEPEDIALDRAVPVYLLYITSWAEGSGRVNFRDDIYGMDARQEEPGQQVPIHETIMRCRSVVESLREVG